MTISYGDLCVCVCVCVCVCLHSILSLYLSIAGNILNDIETERDSVVLPPTSTTSSACPLSMENFSQRICLTSYVLKGYR